jgi:transcriptional regulator with XRE-family HTH domain
VPKSVFTPAYTILLETLIETRRRAGMTQAQLAEKLKRPQPFVSYIERGERRIDVIEFYAIMNALGADPNEVFESLTAQLPAVVAI